MDTVFGLDISHHQDERLDLARAAREGITFVFLKATEGATFNDREFAGNLAEARAAGLLVAAYHYQRTDPAASQVANVRDTVPLDVPVILDVESGSGSVTLTRDLVARLRQAGYRVPLLYLPRWYWQQVGSPSLAGLPPLWSSRYPDNVVGSISDEWDDVPAHYWNGYGGLGVAVLQFTSSASIAGHHPLDANAYRGTRAQLAALLGEEESDDMEIQDLVNFTVTSLVDGNQRSIYNFLVQGEVNFAELSRKVDEIAATVAELKARPVADVDEAALAAELEARGFDGASAAEVKEALRAVLVTTRLDPTDEGV